MRVCLCVCVCVCIAVSLSGQHIESSEQHDPSAQPHIADQPDLADRASLLWVLLPAMRSALGTLGPAPSNALRPSPPSPNLQDLSDRVGDLEQQLDRVTAAIGTLREQTTVLGTWVPWFVRITVWLRRFQAWLASPDNAFPWR